MMTHGEELEAVKWFRRAYRDEEGRVYAIVAAVEAQIYGFDLDKYGLDWSCQVINGKNWHDFLVTKNDDWCIQQNSRR